MKSNFCHICIFFNIELSLWAYKTEYFISRYVYPGYMEKESTLSKKMRSWNYYYMYLSTMYIRTNACRDKNPLDRCESTCLFSRMDLSKDEKFLLTRYQLLPHYCYLNSGNRGREIPSQLALKAYIKNTPKTLKFSLIYLFPHQM